MIKTYNFSDNSTALPLTKAQRVLRSLGDTDSYSPHFFDDGFPKEILHTDAQAVLNVLDDIVFEREELRAELAKSKQCLQGSIDSNLNKLLEMTDEQVTALTRLEGSNPEDVAALARKTMELAVANVKLSELEALYLNSLADATQWQLYKSRKDAVISAGMGRKAMRDSSTTDAPTCTSDEWLANCPQSVRDLADKIKAGLALQPHQQRVVDEKNELDTKANALSQFIGLSPIFEKLDAAEQERLKLQNDVMWQYSEILGERIANF
jgi:hypothetical protein